MLKRQENKLKMYLAMKDFIGKNHQVFSKLPEFDRFFNSFCDHINQILENREKQEISSKGITKSKIALKRDLIAKTMEIANKVEAYASVSDNSELISKVSYSESNLKTSPDTVLRDKCNIINVVAQTELSKLAPYGVTQEMINNLVISIEAFYSHIPKPRTSIVSRKNATQNLADIFRSADYILKRKIDKLAKVIMLSEPELYAKYKSTRLIIDLKRIRTKKEVNQTNKD